jgi:hypothetical protein
MAKSMTENRQPGTTCSGCGGEVENKPAFCPHCGGLFDDTLSCCNHPGEEADGVCVICRRPYCSDCATWVGQFYLCDRHAEYEILEGMVQIFSSTDAGAAEKTFRSLEEAGFHPFLVIRSRSSAPLPARPPSAQRSGPDLVLAPFCEVIDVEKFLAGLQPGQKVDGGIG